MRSSKQWPLAPMQTNGRGVDHQARRWRQRIEIAQGTGRDGAANVSGQAFGRGEGAIEQVHRDLAVLQRDQYGPCGAAGTPLRSREKARVRGRF